MATQNTGSSTPVKVPNAATNLTPATQDPDLRSQINTMLIRDGHVVTIQEHLLHGLNAHSSDWPTKVQNHALALLRSGEISTFPALMRRVMDDIRSANPANAPSANGNTEGSTSGHATNGAANGESSGVATGGVNLSIPNTVVEDALRVTRECLDAVCEIESEGA